MYKVQVPGLESVTLMLKLRSFTILYKGGRSGIVEILRGSSRINLDCHFLDWITVLTGQTLKLDTVVSVWSLQKLDPKRL